MDWHSVHIFLLETKSIIGLLFWGNIFLALGVWGYQISNNSTEFKRSLHWFFIAKFFQGIAWLLIFYRSLIPSFLSVNLGNSGLIIGFYFESVVLLTLLKRKKHWLYRLQNVILMVSLVVFNTIEFLYPLPNVRVAAATGAVFLVLFLPVMFSVVESGQSLFRKIYNINYCLFLVLVSIRILTGILTSGEHIFTNSILETLIFLILFLLMIVGGIGFLLLIKERQDAQIKKLIADKNTFFSIIAHDLRVPIGNIISFSDIIKNKITNTNSDDAQKSVEVVRNLAESSLNLLNNLLIWAKSQSGRLDFSPKHLTLKAVMEEILPSLQSNAQLKNITIHAEIDDVEMYADCNMLKSILSNLVSNAVKFSYPESEVRVSASIIDQQLRIVVSDKGKGMDHATLNRLFRLDAVNAAIGTANEQGSGLGLLLCKDFVERHGGEIKAYSTEGAGSNFVVTLPLKK